MYEGNASGAMNALPLLEPEAAPAERLIDRFADREFTLFGVTAPLSVLAGMCPVGIENMSPAAIDTFVLKVLDKHGVELPEEFAHLRTPEPEVPRGHAQSVATLAAAAIPSESKSAQVASAEDTSKKKVAAILKEPAAQVGRTLPVVTRATSVIESLPVVPLVVEKDDRPLVRRLVLPKESEVVEAKADAQSEPVRTKSLPRFVPVAAASLAKHTLEVAQNSVRRVVGEKPLRPSASKHPKAKAEVFVPATETPTLPEPVEPALTQRFTEQLREMFGLPPEVQQPESERAYEPSLVDEIIERIEPPEPEVTPAIVCDIFASALLQLVGESTHETTDIHLDDETEGVLQVELPAIPPICQEVSERMAVLEPERQEQAAPIIQDIAVALVRIRELQSDHAPRQVIAEAQTELTELCAAFLEAIGLTCDAETVRQFAESILRPEFATQLVNNTIELDLEHLGTHEVKRRMTQMQGTLRYLLVHSLLGSLPLVSAHATLRDFLRSSAGARPL